MKTLFYLSIALLSLTTACSSQKSTNNVSGKNQTDPVEELSGYFVKNTYQSKADVDFLVLKDKTQFDEVLGVAKTMNNQISVPDFGNKLVIAVILKSTENATSLKIKDLIQEGKDLNAHIEVETGSKQTYSATPLYLFQVAKKKDIKQLNLFINEKKRSSVNL